MAGRSTSTGGAAVARAPAGHPVQQSEDLLHFLEAELQRLEPTDRSSRAPSLSRRPVAGSRSPPNQAFRMRWLLDATVTRCSANGLMPAAGPAWRGRRS